MKPSNSLKIFLILNAFLICILISGVSGAECDPKAIVEDCTISTSMTLGGGTYYLNDTNNNGVMVINAHNITVNGNGTIFIGNFSGSSRVFQVYRKFNVTLTNFTYSNYIRAINLEEANNTNVYYVYGSSNTDAVYISRSSNSTIAYSNFFNNSNAHVRILTDSNYSSIYANNMTNARYHVRIEIRSNHHNITSNIISNSTYSSPVGIYIIQNSTNNYVYNNTIDSVSSPMSVLSNNNYIINNTINSSSSSAVLSLYNHNNSYVKGNTFIGSIGSGLDYIISLASAMNITIEDNVFRYGQYPISSDKNSNNIFIIKNIISNGDMGGVLSGNYIYFLNNTIINTTANYDSYDIGLKLSHIKNVIVDNNNFSEMASAGIGWLNATNITISNNYFSFIPFSLRSNYLANDLYDPPCALRGYEAYKSYLGGGLETGGIASLSYISLFRSSDVTINGNSFDENTQCYLIDTASSVISNDLINYWKVSLQAPTFLFDNVDYYISNGFKNLSTYTGNYQDNVFRIRYNSKSMFNVSLEKERYYIYNMNVTYGYNISFKNTNRILVLTNLTYGIMYNNEDLISLDSNNSIDVLNNFNLTEGVSRAYSPLWFSSSNSTNKHVASNLTNTINATIIFNVESCNAKKIIYKSNSLTYQTTYLSGSFTCANNTLQIDNVPIETATSSNEFEIQYVVLPQMQPIQTTFNNVIAKSILGIILISALGFAIRWLVLNITQGEGLVDSVKYLILFIIWMTVFLILFFVISGYIMTNWYPST